MARRSDRMVSGRHIDLLFWGFWRPKAGRLWRQAVLIMAFVGASGGWRRCTAHPTTCRLPPGPLLSSGGNHDAAVCAVTARLEGERIPVPAPDEIAGGDGQVALSDSIAAIIAGAHPQGGRDGSRGLQE